MAQSSGASSKLSYEFWYFDKVYQKIFLPIVVRFSRFIAWGDKAIVDYAVNAIGVMTVVLAHITAWLDKYLVDGFVNVMAFLSRSSGGRLANIQNGKVQGYVLWASIGVLVLCYMLF